MIQPIHRTAPVTPVARKGNSDRKGYRGITGYVYAHDFSDMERFTEYILYEWGGSVYKLGFKWDWWGWNSDNAMEKKQKCNKSVGEEYRFMSSAHERPGRNQPRPMPATAHEKIKFGVFQSASEARNRERYGPTYNK